MKSGIQEYVTEERITPAHGAHEHSHHKEPSDLKPHSHSEYHSHSESDPHAELPSHTHLHTDTKKVLNRLSRAIGHLNAVRGMVEKGRDCSEVLIQLAAVRSAINGICEVILKDHIDHCLVDAVKTGDTNTLKELNRAIELLLK